MAVGGSPWLQRGSECQQWTLAAGVVEKRHCCEMQATVKQLKLHDDYRNSGRQSQWEVILEEMDMDFIERV